MKKIFALIMCLAILLPSISFGVTQEQYLLLVAKGLYNQVVKLKKEAYYANIFRFMNKKQVNDRVQAKSPSQVRSKIQARENDNLKYSCVERKIADKIVETIEKRFPDKAKLIDRDNQKTILWRCAVDLNGESGETFKSLLHCKENCGYKNLPGVRVNHTETEVLSLENIDGEAEDAPTFNSDPELIVEDIQKEEGPIEEESEEEIIGDEIIDTDLDDNSVPAPVVVRWAISQDGFCKKAETGKFSNYGDCAKEAQKRPVKKEVQIKKIQKRNKAWGWFLGALGIR